VTPRGLACPLWCSLSVPSHGLEQRCEPARLVLVNPVRLGPSLKMIDRHYGHVARDGREHAIRLLDGYAD